MYVYKLIVAIILTEALVELFVESKIFESFRMKMSFSELTEYFSNCGYCQSLWVGLIVAMTLDMDMGFCSYYIDIVISGIVVHRLSNVFHGLVGLVGSKIGNFLDACTIEKFDEDKED